MTQPETLLALGFVFLVAATVTYLSAKLMHLLDKHDIWIGGDDD